MMQNLGIILTFLSLYSCIIKSEQKFSAMTFDQEISPQDLNCSQENEIRCPETIDSNPYLCSVLIENNRYMAWGPTECLALKNLVKTSCPKPTDKVLREPLCIPDPSQGECPIPPKPCSLEFQPSTCRAKEYDQRALKWDLQPTARGPNPCKAKENLKIEACYLGLMPSLLNQVECEPDLTQGECPPLRDCQDSDEDQKIPVTCSVDQIGDQPLPESWTVFASSKCDGIYQIRQLACRYATKENGLKPSLLGEINCQENRIQDF